MKTIKLHFKLPYKTYWGQRIAVTGNIPVLGSGDLHKSMNLSYNHPDEWIAEIELSPEEINALRYKYILVNDSNGQIQEEWGDERSIDFVTVDAKHIYALDVWNAPNSLENVFTTSPFKDVLLVDNHPVANLTVDANATHILKVKAPALYENLQICVVGDCAELGNWKIQNPLKLTKINSEDWAVALNLSKVKSDVHYKFGFYDLNLKQFDSFENGFDRTIYKQELKGIKIQKTEGFVNRVLPDFRAAGVSLPVFSIRTKKSFGVGDFVDLKLLIDWAEKVGLKMIQVLPLNDTNGTKTDLDVLPYAAITAFALNPVYLNLPALGKLSPDNPVAQEYKTKQVELNNKELVEFLEIVDFKFKYAKEVFLQQKDSFLKKSDFKKFLKENSYWLPDYAAYCYLRDKFNSPDHSLWKEFAHYDREMINNLVSTDSECYEEIALIYFIQYHLHLQLSNAHDYAHKHKVVFKGDIPIGVNKNSVDTWANADLFNLDKQAGAPPDMFAVKGQNWELPTYNWNEIRKTDFTWWKKRLAQMSIYFDAFRVDHILGFFRIWQIPNEQDEGIMGHLYPSVPVHINEFSEKGIWFNHNRFCKPYITDSILKELFGDEASWVKTNCLTIEDGWILRLKKEYQSQKKVAQMLLDREITEKVKSGLYDLISNVLFFEVEGSNGTQFYPRFGMQSLRTFRELDDDTKRKIEEIYVDYFFRRQDAAWYKSGMDKLPALKKASEMLICGEDLGMMTQCVTDVMRELSVLSLEVQRAPKTNKKEFFHPADAPYLSVVTPSTHDMSTVRAWWEEDRGVTQRFYNNELGHWGEAPYYCEWWICRDILLQHLYSPAMWAVFQLQDLLGISDKIRRVNPNEERINVPSNSKFSWRYRLHINMEDLLKEDEFNAELKGFISASGR